MAYPYYQNVYPTYYPANYQPVYQAPQQPSQPVQQNVNPVSNQSGIIWISGLQEAQMFPVGPNSAVSLWEKDGKTIYLKSADATGRPSLKIYDLVERAETAQDGVQDKDGKSIDYATKDDLGKVVGVVKGIDDVIATMRNDIDCMKGDLYGAVGKRKSVKKQTEVDEDDA